MKMNQETSKFERTGVFPLVIGISSRVPFKQVRQGQPASFCPGGKPGECAGNLKEKPCAVCSDGYTWNGEECTECGDQSALMISCVRWAALVRTHFC